MINKNHTLRVDMTTHIGHLIKGLQIRRFNSDIKYHQTCVYHNKLLHIHECLLIFSQHRKAD